MASINNTLKIDWRGTEYRCLINMRLLDAIEEDINLIKLISETGEGNIKYTRVAILFSHLLNSAGANVTSDDVFLGMFSENSVSRDDVITLLDSVFSAIFPNVGKKKDDGMIQNQ